MDQENGNVPVVPVAQEVQAVSAGGGAEAAVHEVLQYGGNEADYFRDYKQRAGDDIRVFIDAHQLVPTARIFDVTGEFATTVFHDELYGLYEKIKAVGLQDLISHGQRGWTDTVGPTIKSNMEGKIAQDNAYAVKIENAIQALKKVRAMVNAVRTVLSDLEHNTPSEKKADAQLISHAKFQLNDRIIREGMTVYKNLIDVLESMLRDRRYSSSSGTPPVVEEW